MKRLTNIKSFEDLKVKYRTAALLLHPDRGGNLEQMQELNGEYDILFPIWKRKHNAAAATADEQVTETAQESKRNFYTQNGWEGKNYDRNLTTTEIAKLSRQYVKSAYPDWKFSITSEYYSMGSSIHVYLMEGPKEIYVPEYEWSEEQRHEWSRRVLRYEAFHCSEAELEKYKLEAFMLESVQAMIDDVNAFVNSYNFDDSDGMIDYFHCNFHFLKIKIGKWNRPYKIVLKQTKIKQPKPEQAASMPSATALDLEIIPDIDTRDNSPLFVVKIKNKLERDEYKNVEKDFRDKGGYYSRFKKGFIFRQDPNLLLLA